MTNARKFFSLGFFFFRSNIRLAEFSFSFHLKSRSGIVKKPTKRERRKSRWDTQLADVYLTENEDVFVDFVRFLRFFVAQFCASICEFFN